VDGASPYGTRPVTPDDAPAIVALVTACFREYAAFAPSGWVPPTGEGAEARMRAGLMRPTAAGLIASAPGDEHAGHVLWIAAGDTLREPSPDAGLAHLWQLFLEPRHRGLGLGRELLDVATAGAAGSGFQTMRLYTPAGHSAARRFYERAGWTCVGEGEEDRELRLPLVEYQRSLVPPRHN
jgi:GNAT superfamily N-acetyltransferase